MIFTLAPVKTLISLGMQVFTGRKYFVTGQPNFAFNIVHFFYFLFSLTSLSRLFHSYRDEPIGRWGKTGVTRVKPPDTPASRTWLVSHVASAGLEPTPVTAVR